MSHGAIFNDVERSRTKISKSRHYLTLSISETVRDTYMVSMEHQQRLISNDFEWQRNI